MQNRAIEMLTEAYSLIPYYSNRDTVQMLVRLAISEVQELLAQIALHEATNVTPQIRCEGTSSGGVLVVDAPMVPAQLTWRSRPALPGGETHV